MIDYEKLKKAHDLAESNKVHYFSAEFGVKPPCFKIYDSKIMVYVTDSIDELIVMLGELLKPQPKYKYGDQLHYITSNTPVSFTCTESRWDNSLKEYVYGYHGDWSLRESDIYPTREALIDSQIEYWQKLYQQCDRNDGMPTISVKKECDHEPSDDVYLISGATWIKCVKCGEFYR